jgi:hypothetical protein
MLIQDIGIFLGTDLNESEDSLEWVESIYDLVIQQKSIKNQTFGAKEKEDLRLNALNIITKYGVNNIKHWGLKLPETMLCLPELLQAFPKAKVIHLIRHPVSISLRRTHMTSRLDNPVGKIVLKQAYNCLGFDFKNVASTPDQLNNAISWEYQIKNIRDFASKLLNEENYLEVKYEDICNNTNNVKSAIYDFLNVSKDRSLQNSLSIDSSRISKVSKDETYFDEVWRICEKSASLLGYEKYKL